MFRRIKSFIRKYKQSDYLNRIHFRSLLSMIVNFIVSFFKILIGFFSLSIFFVVSGFYSFGMGIARQFYFRGFIKSKGAINEELIYYLGMALSLAFSSIIYIGYAFRLLFNESLPTYHLVIRISIAAVSFLELGLSIYGLRKMFKVNNILFSGLKFVNFSSALAAIALTHSVLIIEDASYDVIIYSTMAICFAVGVISLMMSIYMLVNYSRLNKKEILAIDHNFDIEK